MEFLLLLGVPDEFPAIPARERDRGFRGGQWRR